MIEGDCDGLETAGGKDKESKGQAPHKPVHFNPEGNELMPLSLYYHHGVQYSVLGAINYGPNSPKLNMPMNSTTSPSIPRSRSWQCYRIYHQAYL